jgi:hypothetical protein
VERTSTEAVGARLAHLVFAAVPCPDQRLGPAKFTALCGLLGTLVQRVYTGLDCSRLLSLHCPAPKLVSDPSGAVPALHHNQVRRLPCGCAHAGATPPLHGVLSRGVGGWGGVGVTRVGVTQVGVGERGRGIVWGVWHDVCLVRALWVVEGEGWVLCLAWVCAKGE